MSWLGRIFKENSRIPNSPGALGKRPPKIGPGSQPQAITQKRGGGTPSNTKKPDTIAPPEQIELELRVFHPRIPPEFLKPGVPDLSRPLRFKTEEITALIAQGKITIPLSRIAQQMPDLFSVAISAENDVEVFFPWKKVATLIAAIDPQADTGQTPAQPDLSLFKRITGKTVSPPPAPRPWTDRMKGPGQANRLPPPHLREPDDSGSPEQKRATLHARKKAWFRGEAGSAEGPVEGMDTQADLQKENEALKAELIQTRKERDDALAALGLSAPNPEEG